MSTHETENNSPTRQTRRRTYGRIVWALAILVLLMIAALVPPLINVGRYRFRVANSIGEALGRPVHIDNISLTVLPVPGFTLQNFVVSEDPVFGQEPVLRANEVHVTLRLSSLWRRRLEASSISLTEPSVNLVRSEDGRWNVQSILINAAQVEAEPTGQARAGNAPRFPYVEARNARVNLKLGREKTPFSLADADFALWLPSPQEWRLRLEGRPARTDTDATDTGTLRVEGTLQRADAFRKIPLNLHAAWQKVPLGEATKVILAHDAGWRGTMDWSAEIRGTFEEATVQTRIFIDQLRKAEFYPLHPVSPELRCTLRAENDFLALKDVACTSPGDGGVIAVAGSIEDVREPEQATVQIGTPKLDATVLLDWARVFSPRISPQVSLAGTASGSFEYLPSAGWTGHLEWKNAVLHTANGDLLKAPSVSLVTDPSSSRPPVAERSGFERFAFNLENAPVALGGKDAAVLGARIDREGYSLRLAGPAEAQTAKRLAADFPPVGDGLDAVLPATGATRLDLASTRKWGADQVWSTPAIRTPRRR